jgi:hypothetical protein
VAPETTARFSHLDDRSRSLSPPWCCFLLRKGYREGAAKPTASPRRPGAGRCQRDERAGDDRVSPPAGDEPVVDGDLVLVAAFRRGRASRPAERCDNSAVRGTGRYGGTPTEAQRAHYIGLVRRLAEDGKLSNREREERIEGIFRARSSKELEAAVLELPGSAATRFEAGSFVARRRGPRGGSWLRRLVIYTICIDAIGVAIWAATGGGVIWLELLFILSLASFTYRVMRRGQGGLLKGSRKRRR